MIQGMEEKGMNGIDEILPSLPEWLRDDLTKPEFKENCEAHFLMLDEDDSGELSIEETYKVLQELTGEKPIHIEKRHCHRFVSAFDNDGNGNLDLHEFTNFVRFAMAMCYLEGERVKEQQRQADLRLQETMATLGKDLATIEKVIAGMPLPVRKMMENVEYTKTFKDRWNSLDTDRSGTLDIDELLPLVQEMCAGCGIEEASLDIAHC